ncbi:MAG TPA: Uma2 family endonuclease, partial [Thermoanaerobaculia bacterium]|nr:Uma2 family endonuclease [Thermoanaerobaculia bacterium]
MPLRWGDLDLEPSRHLRGRRGALFSDRTRVVSPAAGLSVEPDVVVVLWESLRQGRIREIPAAKAEADRFIELEEAPDLIVEIVSDSSRIRAVLDRVAQSDERDSVLSELAASGLPVY